MAREPRSRNCALLALLLTLIVSTFRPAPAAAFAPSSALTLASFDLHANFLAPQAVFQTPQLAVALSRSATVTYSLNAFSLGSLLRGSSVFATAPGGPIITNAIVTPDPLPVTGGNVTVSADVTDSSANISSVFANIYDTNGNLYNQIRLTNTGGSTYSSSAVTIPQNLSNTKNGFSIKVQATDNSNNTALTPTLATQGFDSTAPTITNTTVTPNPPPVTGGNVTVSADVTDAGTGVASVIANIYDTNGNLYNTIPLTSAGGSTYSNSAVNIPQNLSNTKTGYSIKVQATDRSGNTAITGTLAVQGFDNTAPTISNASVTPNPPPVTGGNVTVSADVTDAGTGVSTVYAYIYDTNGNVYNAVPLTSAGGGTYSSSAVNIPQNLSNTKTGYSVKVQATDRSGNTAITGTLAVQGFDNTAPTISNASVTPNPPPVTGGNVTVSADVTDAGTGVSTVYAYIYDTNGNVYNAVPLTSAGGGTYSNSAVNIPQNLSNTRNGYSVKVQATDRSGNTAITGTLAVQGFDNTAPTISNASVTPSTLPVLGGNVTVSADVTDAGTGVSTVYAYIYDTNGNVYNAVPLTSAGGGTYSSSAVNIPQNLSNTKTGYSVKVQATDRSGNTAITGTLAVQGFDNTAPTISNASVTPNPPPVTGGNVTVSADVTDAGTGVSTVYAYIYDTNGNVYNAVPLTSAGGGTYSSSAVNIPQNLSNTKTGYSVKVQATDRSGNTAITGTLAVQGFDSTAPTISNITQTPSLLPESGGKVTLTANVTDAGTGVSTVSALVYKDGATNAGYSVTLSNGGSGSAYTGTYTIGASGNTATHTFAAVVAASDRSGNQATANTGNLVYQSDGAPNPVPQITSLSPSQVAQGTTTDTTVTVSGSSFVPQSVVLVNGSAVPTIYGGNTLLYFTLPVSGAVNAGTYTVQVYTPPLFGTDGGTSASLPLAVVPVSLTSLTFPSSVPGGTVLTATVTLNEVTPVDVVVGLSSSSTIVRLNRAVMIPAGSSSATFAINTFRSHTTSTVTIQAALGQVALTKDLTITGR